MKCRTNQPSYGIGVLVALAVLGFTTPASSSPYFLSFARDPFPWDPHPILWCKFCCSAWDAYRDFTPDPAVSALCRAPYTSTLKDEDIGVYVSRSETCSNIVQYRYNYDDRLWSCACPNEWPHVASIETMHKAEVMYESVRAPHMWHQLYALITDGEEERYRAEPYKYCASHSMCGKDPEFEIDTKSSLSIRDVANSLDIRHSRTSEMHAIATIPQVETAVEDDWLFDDQEFLSVGGRQLTGRTLQFWLNLWEGLMDMSTRLALMASRVICILVAPVFVGVLLRRWDDWIKPAGPVANEQRQHADSRSYRTTSPEERVRNAGDESRSSAAITEGGWIVVDGECGERNL